MMRRMFLGTMLGALGTAPVWAVSPAGAQAQTVVNVACTGAGPSDLHDELCTKLRNSLAKFYPDTVFVRNPDQTAVMMLTLHVQRVSDRSVTARLDWTKAATPPGTSSDVTAGTRDKLIGSREYDMLIKSLIRTAKLPL